MEEIPLRNEHGNAAFLRDVATPKDASFIQTNVVRVNGKRQVYIPVFRQLGASTLQVVDTLKGALETMKARLTRPGIDLKVVMDQSVYVRHSIESLVEEGVLGAVLCSLVILLFLGEWRMTVIAVLTIPISVLAAVIGLYATGNTINVMTLAGLALAIGPLVDSAIICLENTHRHLGLGATPEEAAFLRRQRGGDARAGREPLHAPGAGPAGADAGPGRVPLPADGAGRRLRDDLGLPPVAVVRPVPIRALAEAARRRRAWTRQWQGHEPSTTTRSDASGRHDRRAVAAGCFAALRALGGADRRGHRLVRPAARSRDEPSRSRRSLTAVGLLVATLVLAGHAASAASSSPRSTAGAFEIYARRPSGTRIEETEKKIAKVEQFVRDSDRRGPATDHLASSASSPTGRPPTRPTPARWTRSSRSSSTHEREHSAQEYVQRLRTGFAQRPAVRRPGVRLRRRRHDPLGDERREVVADQHPHLGQEPAAGPRRSPRRSSARSSPIDGVVDARIIQRLDYPEYIIDVDRAKAADLGLNQADVMKNVVAALNSSIQFHKKNFWIDPVSKNQYFVGVQYLEEDIDSVETLLDVPITSPDQDKPIPLRNIATLRRSTVPTEITHNNLQSTIDLTMGVHGRDLGHVADDVARVVAPLRRRRSPTGRWSPTTRRTTSAHRRPIKGAHDRAQRRVLADAGHLPQPGLRPGPGVAADLLPDGGPVQVVPDAAGRSCSPCRSAWSAWCRCSTSPARPSTCSRCWA